ncbi:MAG: flavin monoamine oxidase family protein, partial [Anaerolineales bacterium]
MMISNQNNLSRRRFLQLSGALVGGSLLPARWRLQDARADVVVVGAGLSGLMAARDLVAAGVESVYVLEAKPMLGGRAINVPFGDGQEIEGGGQFVGPTQERILALAEEYGVERVSIFTEGGVLFSKDGNASQRPNFEFAAFGEYNAINAEINELAQQVPLDAPWTAPQAAEWDAMSVGDFLSTRMNFDDTRLFYEISTFAVLNALPDEISLLYFLFYVHSAGNLDQLLGVEGAAQDSRFVGGPQRLMLAMAQDIGTDRIRLDSPVTRIAENADGTLSIDAASGSIQTQYAIIAMMPSAIPNITFEPALPDMRQNLNTAWPASGDFKINVV